MSWPWVAYYHGRSASIAWDGRRLRVDREGERFAPPDGDDPVLVWDMRGVLGNRPDPGPLPLNPKRQTLVDSGTTRGDDVIDCLMADRGTVVLPLRHLNGLAGLAEALDFSDELVVGIDWTGDVVAQHADFRIDLDRLFSRLSRAGVRRLLLACLDGPLPFLPAGVLGGFEVYIAMLGGDLQPPEGVAGVFRAV